MKFARHIRNTHKINIKIRQSATYRLSVFIKEVMIW